MTKLVKLSQLTDPDAAAYVTDAFGEPMAVIYVRDLEWWAGVIEHLDRWLQHAAPAIWDDFDEFMADRFGPVDHATLGNISWALSAIGVRLRVLINEAPS